MTFLSDPGHGWLQCSRDVLDLFNVHTSHCSYERGGFVYLEEDCDAPRLLAAMKAAGVEVVINEAKQDSGESKIRNYNSYMPRP